MSKGDKYRTRARDEIDIERLEGAPSKQGDQKSTRKFGMSVPQARQKENKKDTGQVVSLVAQTRHRCISFPVVYLVLVLFFVNPLFANAAEPGTESSGSIVNGIQGTSSDPVVESDKSAPGETSAIPGAQNISKGALAIPLNSSSAPLAGKKVEGIHTALGKEQFDKKCAPRIADLKADCVVTHAGVVVSAVPNFACHFDTDKDGILDEKDSCPNTPPRTRVDDTGCAVPIVFPEPILYRINSEFDFDKSDLRPDALQILGGLVKDLKGKLLGSKVQIVGHTDSKGSDEYNFKLSMQRAGAVARYLEEQGIPSTSITFDGKGEREPIASNKTDAGRAQNRRIDVHVEGGDESYKTGRYADGSGCPVPVTIDVYTLTAEFDTGSAVLKQAAISGLDEILEKLRQTPMEELIDVVGHTDSRGSDEKNRLLSLARARSAADYLVEQGIPANYITIDGKGESKPIGDNSTPNGRRKNRRIEIRTR